MSFFNGLYVKCGSVVRVFGPHFNSKYDGCTSKVTRTEEISMLLLRICDGKLKDEDGKVNIPNNLSEVVKDVKTLTHKAYQDLTL